MKNKGFTLIEILIVVTIIGILATTIIANYMQAQSKSRDSKRIADLNLIATSLQMYNNINKQYPDNVSSTIAAQAGCWDAANGDFWDPGSEAYPNIPFLQALEDKGYLNPVPREPKLKSCSYRYVKQDLPLWGCVKKYAVLFASLENARSGSLSKDERPEQVGASWTEGAPNSFGYAIYLPEN